MNWKVPHLKLTHKGLLLVSIPLTCELLLLCIFGILLYQAESAAYKEAQSKAIIAGTNDLSKLLYDAGEALVAYRFTGEKTHAIQFDRIIEKVPGILRSLEQLSRGDKQRQAALGRVKQALDRSLILLSQYRKTMDDSDKVLYFINGTNLRREAKYSVSKFTEEIHKVSDAEHLKQTAIPQLEASARAHLKQLVVAGAAINSLLAVCLAIYFSKDITKRISTMVENTRLLAQSKPLHPRLKGKDEIGYLDEVFHQMNDSLKEAARLKSEFVSMISHELRTPLTSLQVTLNLLLEGEYGELSNFGKKRVSYGERNIERLVGLINELLDIEKLEVGKADVLLRDLSLLPVINRSIESLSDLSEKKRLRLSITHNGSSEVLADSERLTQVLINLLGNAIKFAPENSEVKVSVRNLSNWVEVRIIDQGPGIPADKLDKVFDRFTQVCTTDGAPPNGSGLGLTISKAIIEAHGGTIGVESEEGKGSSFWFRLIPKEQSTV